jgi:hypothetical protein
VLTLDLPLLSPFFLGRRGVIIVQVVLINFHFAREMNSKSSVHVLEMVTQTITGIIQTKTGKRLVYTYKMNRSCADNGFPAAGTVSRQKKSLRLLRVKITSFCGNVKAFFS